MINLVVGLGNPGQEYSMTRHNVGFMAIDLLHRRYSSYPLERKFNSEITKIKILGFDVILAKPMNYMNCSGEVVFELMRFYKINPKDVFILHDDLDLECGRIKCKLGGGSGGHNGIKSIDHAIGKNYNRVRIGISRPEFDVPGYVLSNFLESEFQCIEVSLENIVANIHYLLSDRSDLFMNSCTRKK